MRPSPRATRSVIVRLRSKRRETPEGTIKGGRIMAWGQLHRILTNPIYVGRIRHKGEFFEGRYEAGIEPDR